MKKMDIHFPMVILFGLLSFAGAVHKMSELFKEIDKIKDILIEMNESDAIRLHRGPIFFSTTTSFYPTGSGRIKWLQSMHSQALSAAMQSLEKRCRAVEDYLEQSQLSICALKATRRILERTRLRIQQTPALWERNIVSLEALLMPPPEFRFALADVVEHVAEKEADGVKEGTDNALLNSLKDGSSHFLPY